MPRVFDRKRMTKLILVRHGHVEGISPERFRGRAELPLTELGRREAEITARRIAATWRPAAIYTSPMGRCVETGTAIGKPFGLSSSAMPGLNDIDYGDWQGLTTDEARARWNCRCRAIGGSSRTRAASTSSISAPTASRSWGLTRPTICGRPSDRAEIMGKGIALLAMTAEVIVIARSGATKQSPRDESVEGQRWIWA